MLFCPPTKAMRARRLARKQAKQQRKALEEARAVGWNQCTVDDVDMDEDDDEELNNEHNTWTDTTASPEQKQFLEPNSEDEDDSSCVSNSSSGSSSGSAGDALPPDPSIASTFGSPIQVKSFGGVQVFSPEFFETAATTTDSVKDDETDEIVAPILPAASSTTAASTSSSGDSHHNSSSLEDEDNENSEIEKDENEVLLQQQGTHEDEEDDNECPQDDTALENKEELHAMLERLEGARSNNSARSGMATSRPPETGNNTSMSTIDMRSVSSFLSSPPPLSTASLFSASQQFRPTPSIESFDEDDEDNDDDSCDYGAWTTKTSIAIMEPLPSAPPVAEKESVPTTATTKSDLLQFTTQSCMDRTDPLEEEDDDEDEEPHEGSQVFMIAEGNRYSDTCSQDNGLFPIQKVMPGASTSTTGNGISLASRLMGSGSVSHTFAPQAQEMSDFLPHLEEGSDEDENNLVPTPWEKPFFTPGGTFVSPSKKGAAAAVGDTSTPPPLFSPLSSMVHPINLKLFEDPILDQHDPFDDSFSTVEESSVTTDARSVVSCPVAFASDEPFLRSSEYSFGSNNTRRLSSSFRSCHSRRVAYSLLAGKRAMSKSERLYSKALLPKHVIESNNKQQHQNNNSEVSVLLAHVQEHVFEVVAVDLYRDTTVGDVLSKARSGATDPVLAEQLYTSLCVGQQEFAAPMLPMSLLLSATESVVVAVPEGTTAQTMYTVKKALLRHPKLKKLFRKQQHHQETSTIPEHEIDDDDDDTLEEKKEDGRKSFDADDETLDDEEKKEALDSFDADVGERSAFDNILMAKAQPDPSESFELHEFVVL